MVAAIKSEYLAAFVGIHTRECAWQRVWTITDQVRPMLAQAAKPIEMAEREILEDVKAFRQAHREGKT